MSANHKRNQKSSELGFGEKAYGKNTRLITQSGDFNVKKSGLGFGNHWMFIMS